MATRILTGSIYDISENARPDFALQMVVSPTAITPTGIIPESTEPIATDDDGNFNIEVVTGIQLEVWLYDAFRRIGTTTNFGNGNIIKRGMVVPHGVSPITVQAVLALNTEPDVGGDVETIINALLPDYVDAATDGIADAVAATVPGVVDSAVSAAVPPAVDSAVSAATAGIPGMVTTAVNDVAPGLVDAAVDGALDGKADSLAIIESDFSFAVVDEDGRRTWIEANAAGGLTDHAADKISERIAGALEMDTDVTGLSFVVVDEDGRRTEIEVGDDGKLTQRVIDSIRDRVGLSIPANIVSGSDIVCWGDSMTAGAGGSGTTYPNVLATLTGHMVRNRGVGGETSVTITARTGANPMLVIPDGGTIPSSGGVVIAIQPINGSTPAPLLQGHHGYNVGSIAGVAGTISESSGTYTFTRSEAGDPVTVNRPTPWMDAESPSRRGDIAIIWIGQNGPSHARAKSDVAAIVRHMDALDKRYLVISKPTSSDGEDAEWHDLYGRRFIAIRQYMVAYGLADAGITPTAQDTTDMSNGVVPESLRSDTIHWNAAGYTILGQQCNARMRELGWV